MPRILLTAFEPFDDTGVNSSLEVMRAFREEFGCRYDLAHCVLPVRYDDDVAALEEGLRVAEPELLLLTGQTSRFRVGVERIAVNVRTESDAWEPLRRGCCTQRLIRPEGPPAYFATLPVEAIDQALRNVSVPAELSNHAGIYLCNHILYQSLHRAGVDGLPRRIGFLHLPCLPEQLNCSGVPPPPDSGSPRVTLETLVTAVRVTLDTALVGSRNEG